MIKILIVDDSQPKIYEILQTVKKIPEINDESIETCSDIISAKRLIELNQYDLMILDIQLPVRFGEQPKPDAGVLFLQELSISKTYKKPFHIIGLTSHESLKQQFSRSFEDELWTLIHYEENTADWRGRLNNKLKYLIQSKNELMNPSNSEYFFDIAIVTALSKPELRAVLDLEGDWQEERYRNDPATTYYKGQFKSSSKTLSVVAASCNHMGMTSAAVLSMKIIQRFRPRYICMLGIAAGVRGKGNFGDILIAEHSWDYGSGKNRLDNSNNRSIFEPDPRPIIIDADILGKFSNCISENKYLNNIQNNWRAFEISTPLRAFLGPVASGSSVLENIQLIEEQIKNQQRKVIGIEMELYGVYSAARFCANPQPKFMAIKSICDFGDEEKNDKYQTYAAYTSARYFYHFALEYL